MTKERAKLNLRMEPDLVPIGAKEPTPAPVPKAEPRKQVGARIPEAQYRQLKSRAAMEGRPVQDLVEEAIGAYLAAV